MPEGEVVPSPASEARPEESISFKLPGLPPSVNSLYQIIFAQRRVELKPEVRMWKSKAKGFVPMWAVETMQPLGISIAFHGNWLFKNATFRKLDLQNLIKVVVDAVAEKQGWNDCQVFKFKAIKVQDQSEFVQVTVNRL